jgi:hypothetical protein
MKYITVEPLFKTIKRQEAEIQGLLHPAKANLGYFLAWFQSLQLSSTQSESPVAVITLTPKSHVCFKVLIFTHFSNFNPDYPTSGLTVAELASVYCTKIKIFSSS